MNCSPALVVFAVSAFAILYCYAFYPALLALLPFRRHHDMGQPAEWPKASVLISVYNEEKHIAARIENLLALDYPHADTFNVGSDNVKSLAEVYEYVIRNSGSKARVATLPRGPAIAAMKLAYHLRLSPLGPYHYKMIAEDFLFDTSRIKQRLGWRPTMNNEEMLWRAYQYYSQNRSEIQGRQNVSAHRKAAKMGVIRLLKWCS